MLYNAAAHLNLLGIDRTPGVHMWFEFMWTIDCGHLNQWDLDAEIATAVFLLGQQNSQAMN